MRRNSRPHHDLFGVRDVQKYARLLPTRSKDRQFECSAEDYLIMGDKMRAIGKDNAEEIRFAVCCFYWPSFLWTRAQAGQRNLR